MKKKGRPFGQRYSVQRMTRLDKATDAGLVKAASKYLTTPSELLRWAAEEICKGRYIPAHARLNFVDIKSER